MLAVIFPGQGAQSRGMGRDLFDAYPGLTRQASETLGYSIRELCLEDQQRRLGATEYTQPALFVVGALAYRRWRECHDETVGFFAGHSLGEYSALHAAGAFDFETGLRLVARRGQLMARARGGGMAAVVGLDPARLEELLRVGGFGDLTIANDNAPTQQVVSGESAAIAAMVDYLTSHDVRSVRLNVSGAFHSPLMRAAQRSFAEYIDTIPLGDPAVPVVANATARPYRPGATADLLTQQITSQVRWTGSVRYLLESGVDEFVELGGQVLDKLVKQIRVGWRPTARLAASTRSADPIAAEPADPARAPASPAAALGSTAFRRRLGLRYAYLAGGMYRNISSVELVVRLGRAGMLGFLGTGGVPPAAVERRLRDIARGLPDGGPYGVNVLANPTDPAAERAMVELLLQHRVRTIEASAFIEVSPALVLFRTRGLRRGPDGAPVCDHHVVAKVSRPEVAQAFLAPAPEPLLTSLVAQGAITAEQAELARRVPMSHDITVEADSGGHTDGGVASAMMPAMLRLRDQAQQRHRYAEPVCLGLAGGIGTPAAAAAAFLLGADYVLTGSINQCTVESGMSDAVKEMLQDIDIQDTCYAPAGDMFELGAKVQVLRRGVFFPNRANKLYSLYTHYDSLDDIPARTRTLLERTYFCRPISEVWAQTRDYFESQGQGSVVAEAESRPKRKMALVFRWYFSHTARLALDGEIGDRVNFQVHTGPALGSFNQWVKGTECESWKKRHVDRIALMLLDGAAEHIDTMCHRWRAATGAVSTLAM